MRFLTKMFAAVGFSLIAAGALASPDNPQAGTDYRVLDKAQQTESANKVEVLEFFWFNCPHCNALEPALEAWVKKHGDNIVFKRVPVAFRESFVPQQRMYYALEAMGKADEMQKKIFRTIHVDRKPLDTEAQIMEFIAASGIDKQKFADLYNSFGVQTKVARATQLQRAYAVDGVPMLAIGGRYLTSPSIIAGSIGNQPSHVLHEGALKVADHLVAKSKN